MAQGPESRETTRLVKDIKLYDPSAFVYKVAGGAMARRGVPDLYVCTGGKSWWLEVKVKPNQLTAIQEATIKEMHEAGCNVRVLTLGMVGKTMKMYVHKLELEASEFPCEGPYKFRHFPLERKRGEHWDVGRIFDE